MSNIRQQITLEAEIRTLKEENKQLKETVKSQDSALDVAREGWDTQTVRAQQLEAKIKALTAFYSDNNIMNFDAKERMWLNIIKNDRVNALKQTLEDEN